MGEFFLKKFIQNFMEDPRLYSPSQMLGLKYWKIPLPLVRSFPEKDLLERDAKGGSIQQIWGHWFLRATFLVSVAEAGIQEVEYQLMVIPDSAHLLPFVGLDMRHFSPSCFG